MKDSTKYFYEKLKDLIPFIAPALIGIVLGALIIYYDFLASYRLINADASPDAVSNWRILIWKKVVSAAIPVVGSAMMSMLTIFASFPFFIKYVNPWDNDEFDIKKDLINIHTLGSWRRIIVFFIAFFIFFFAYLHFFKLSLPELLL